MQVGHSEIDQIVEELLRLRVRAEAAGALGTAFMIVAAARQADKELGLTGRAERAFEEMLSREPEEFALRYDVNGG